MIKKILLNSFFLIGAFSNAMQAPIDKKSEDLKSLWLACKQGDVSKAAQLLAAGVDPSIPLHFNAPLDEIGFERSTCLHFAAAAGHTPIVQLLMNYPVLVNICDENGWTPLIGALAFGHEQIVQLLMKAGSHVNDIDYLLGHRPLATPIQCLNPKLVKVLLDSGAQTNPPSRAEMPVGQYYRGNALHILFDRLAHKPSYAPSYSAAETERRAIEIIETIRTHGVDMSCQLDEKTVLDEAICTMNKRLITSLLVRVKIPKECRNEAHATLKTFLLTTKRIGFPREIVLNIIYFLPIECKYVGIEHFIVPKDERSHYRAFYLDECAQDIRRTSECTAADIDEILHKSIAGPLFTPQSK